MPPTGLQLVRKYRAIPRSEHKLVLAGSPQVAYGVTPGCYTGGTRSCCLQPLSSSYAYGKAVWIKSCPYIQYVPRYGWGRNGPPTRLHPPP